MGRSNLVVKCSMSELQHSLKIATEYLQGGIGEQSAPRAKLESQSGENGKLLPSDQKQRASGICSADEQTRNIMGIFFFLLLPREREKQKKSYNKKKQSRDFLGDQENQESKKDNPLLNRFRRLNGGNHRQKTHSNFFIPGCLGIPRRLLHK